MEVHLVDGTYELFRHYFGQRTRPRLAADGREVAAAIGVVTTIVTMLDEGARHLAVATDHPIESFRNEMWPAYKDSSGVPEDLLGQLGLIEAALSALGVRVLVMDELEADDGLATAAAVAERDERVDRVLIWTPDKDLAQCVRAERVVQVDRRSGVVLGEDAVVAKFGVSPESIPDWLALVGDNADGFPGLQGWGKQTASVVLGTYPHLEQIPPNAGYWSDEVLRRVRSAGTLANRLQEEMEAALLFRDLATLRTTSDVVTSVDDLRWDGPREEFREVASYLGSTRLADRVVTLAATR